MQEKWLAFFEKVVGRKPTPQEFVAGKESGFDLTTIRSIAGLGEAGERHPSPTPMPGQIPPQIPIPVVNKKKSSLKKGLMTFLAIAGLGLAGAYYYGQSLTGPDSTAKTFLAAVETNDYETIASLLSRKGEKWTKDEARKFVQYLTEADVNLKEELAAIAESKGEILYRDANGNKLLGMEVTGKRYGIFPTYQVVTYPLEVSVETDLDNLEVSGKALEGGQETYLGESKFIPTEYQVSGETDLGKIDTIILTDVSQASDNKLVVSLLKSIYTLNASLPDQVAGATDIALFVNDKLIANQLVADVDLLASQKIEVYASFSYQGSSYQTEVLTTSLPREEEFISLNLLLSKETLDKIEKATAEKEAAAANERLESEINQFVTDFFLAHDNSVRTHSDLVRPFFNDSNNKNYQDILSDGIGRQYAAFETTGSKVYNLKIDGDTITFTNQFTRDLIHIPGSGKGKETVHYSRDWILKRSSTGYYIESYSTY